MVVPRGNESSELPLRLRWKEPEHGDGEQIVLKRLFAEVVPMWKGGNFDANVMNAGTGRAFGKGHHVKGEAGKSKRDFENLTFGFCLEFIDFSYRNVVYRVRCLNQFTVHSQQCIDHPKPVCKDGPNKIYDILAAGRVATYGMIKDAKIVARQLPLTAEQRKQKALADKESILLRIEEATDKGDDVTQLLAEYEALVRTIGGKSGKDKTQASPLPLAAAAAVADAPPLLPSRRPTTDTPIYGARRFANKSVPGIEALDEKFKLRQNPNNIRNRAVHASKLPTTAEQVCKVDKTGKKKNMVGLNLS